MGRSFGQMITGGMRASVRGMRNPQPQGAEPALQPQVTADGQHQAPAPPIERPAPQLSDLHDAQEIDGPVASDDLIGHIGLF